ncbi:MAG TPA: hypothetical protein VF298_04025, partial [Bacteroidales bacterium]
MLTLVIFMPDVLFGVPIPQELYTFHQFLILTLLLINLTNFDMKTLARQIVIILTIFLQYVGLSHGQILAGTDDTVRAQLQSIQLPSSTSSELKLVKKWEFKESEQIVAPYLFISAGID